MRRRKSSVRTVSDRPGRHVEQREPVQFSGLTRFAQGQSRTGHPFLFQPNASDDGCGNHRRSRNGVNVHVRIIRARYGFGERQVGRS